MTRVPDTIAAQLSLQAGSRLPLSLPTSMTPAALVSVLEALPFALPNAREGLWPSEGSDSPASAAQVRADWSEALSLGKPGFQRSDQSSATLSLDWNPASQERALPMHRSLAKSLATELSLLADLLPERLVLRQLEMAHPLALRLREGDLEDLLVAMQARFEGLSSCDRILKVDARSPHCSALLVRFAALGFRQVHLMLGTVPDPRLLDLDEAAGLVRQAHELGYSCAQVHFECPQEDRQGANYGPWLRALLAARPQRVEVRRPIAPVTLIRPQDSEAWRLWLTTVDALLAQGYCALGQDWFACSDDRLAQAKQAGRLVWKDGRFLKSPAGDSYGLGPGNHSRVCGVSARNLDNERAYSLALEQGHLPVAALRRWNRLDLARETMTSALICQEHLEYQALELAHLVVMSRDLAPEMQALVDLQRLGLLESQEDGVQVTSLGRLLSSNLSHALRQAAHSPMAR